ncbi:type III secretion system stator protein SctL [Paracoccus onubensis]|uniref:Type 3 secretion system stator protein n=1 Tax=Paracoccus onubensis TaxID=1675788 RepID=A0A418T8B8_9RHOB|nr:type III secretion system stator protein SctL [Paracoccus onubensis]RJE89484.1 HrpE/YscL family type III secretion apparatus protein [Paracoccus onubensis]
MNSPAPSVTALPDRPHATILRPDEAEAWQNGFAFLNKARAEAEAIRESAEGVVALAREEGRQSGRTQGESEAAELLLRTQDDVTRYLAGIQSQLADLVLIILHEILDQMDDAALIVQATRRALKEFRESHAITLSVPPDLMAQVEAQLASDQGLRVVPDRHLTGRRCILTSPVSSIDISLDAQIAAYRRAMDGA